MTTGPILSLRVRKTNDFAYAGFGSRRKNRAAAVVLKWQERARRGKGAKTRAASFVGRDLSAVRCHGGHGIMSSLFPTCRLRSSDDAPLCFLIISDRPDPNSGTIRVRAPRYLRLRLRRRRRLLRRRPRLSSRPHSTAAAATTLGPTRIFCPTRRQDTDPEKSINVIILILIIIERSDFLPRTFDLRRKRPDFWRMKHDATTMSTDI